jgi:hypothetical protein
MKRALFPRRALKPILRISLRGLNSTFHRLALTAIPTTFEVDFSATG